MSDSASAMTPGVETSAVAGAAGGARSRVAWAGVLVVGVALAALPLALPAPLAAGVIVGGAALAVIALYPAVGLYAMPFAVAFGSLVSLTVKGTHIGPTDLLVGALAVAWVARLRTGGLRTGPRTGAGGGWRGYTRLVGAGWRWARLFWARERVAAALIVALLAYLGVVMLSLVVALNRAATLKEIIKWSEVAALMGLTLWQLRAARDGGRLRALVWAVIAAGVAEALLGYAQWALAAGDAGPGGGSIRVFGTFDQPNPFSGYLNFALALALAIALFGRDARERWLAAGGSALLLGAQALANSRGGLIGLAAALMVLAVVGWRRERLAGIAAAIGVPVVALAWVTHVIPTRIEQSALKQLRINDVAVGGAVNDANFSTMERLAHWVAGLRMFQAHPALGVGAGNYDTAYARYALPGWELPLGHAHNYYINAAAETGVVGLLVFLALTGALLVAGWRAARTGGSASAGMASGARGYALGVFAALVALSAHNLTDDLFVHGMELELAMLLGVTLALLLARRTHGDGARGAALKD